MYDVAALYIDPKGPYPKIPGVDCWDESRDARKYNGDLPVIVHPPCHLWTNFAELNYRRYGKESLRPGNDGGKFSHALKVVRRNGGVLEHPAFTKAWARHMLVRPREGWLQADINEWVCEVWQSAYGHKARKRTWLLYVGNQPPPDLNWERKPGTCQIGYGWNRIKPVLSKAEASRTPETFAELLVSLARGSR